MLRTFLASVFRATLTQLVEQGRLPNEVLNVRIEIADPKNPEHGDFACNIAMTASKLAGKNPREFAEMLVEAVSSSEPIFEKVEIAGPGFINLTLNSEFVAAYVETINSLSHGDLAKQNPAESPFKINVEFVSVNPNGPITIGSGRGAAYGSTLCNIFEAAGHTVHREYYINDGVNSEQMRLFAESVRALIKGESVPENGYKGDYVHDVAKELQGQNLESAEVVVLQKASEQKMIEAQRTALAAFGVNYDTWFSEQSLHDAGTVAAEIDSLAAKGIANTDPTRTKLKLAKGGKIEDVVIESQTADVDDEGEVQQAEATAEGETLWLRSTKLGDDMDRVLLR